MKILLINPPVEDFFFTPQRAYPLGILYLATVLRPAGFTVRVLNALAHRKKVSLNVPAEFSGLRRYYTRNKSPFSLFSSYYHFGLADHQIAAEIRDFSPQVVGISSNFSPYFDSSLKIARMVKELDKRISVVIGGRVLTSLPESGLREMNVDFVVRGEAEYTFLKLCQAIERGKLGNIEGVCYRLAGKDRISSKIPIIEDLNQLPLLDRSFIDPAKYKFRGRLFASLLASRGCGLGCCFCAIKEKLRYRRAENVFKEMEEAFLIGIKHFNFEDDNINLNPEFEDLLDLIIGKFSGKIKISFMNGLLAKGMKRTLREKIIKVGVTHFDFSLVSSNKEIRKKTKRIEETKDIFSVSNYMADRKIFSTVHFITGLPFQKFEDCLRDLKLLAEKRVYLGMSIFYPVIGSGLFEVLKQDFCIDEKDYKFFRSSCAYFDKEISRDKIFFVFYLSRIINFIKDLMDKFSLTGNRFFSFLEGTAGVFFLENNWLISSKRIDTLTIGLILLRRMLKENKIFRVEEKQSEQEFCYSFLEEEFIRQEDVKTFLSRLKIISAAGRYIKLKGVYR